ncbi:MAG: hypothetical protein Q8906_15385 [Bacillota bacterium]|nr:hypothetical protein [Bacillota bacterium]MDP4171991.1 hypothetical protein [Bacillota bacterium]
MDKKMVEKVLALLTKIILAAGAIAFIIAIIDVGNTLKLLFSGVKAGKSLKEINKNIGTIAEIVGIATGVLWLFRTVWVEMKKRKWPFHDWIQQLYLLLKKNHIFLGCVTLAVSFAHGLYFFLHQGKHIWVVYSGIATFLSLVVLALLGYNHQQNKTTKKNRVTKKRHMLMALVFAILFLIHLNI